MAAILRFVVANHVRRRLRRNTDPVDPGLLDRTIAAEIAAPTNLENVVDSWRQPPDDQAEFDDVVVAALKSLSPDARLCLLLNAVEELSYAEIAALLDIPEGTAMSHVSRAKRFLRDRLRPHYLSLPKTVSSVP
jgi:RNA polymerase sigma-70 factor (ECF subfamily)